MQRLVSRGSFPVTIPVKLSHCFHDQPRNAYEHPRELAEYLLTEAQHHLDSPAMQDILSLIGNLSLPPGLITRSSYENHVSLTKSLCRLDLYRIDETTSTYPTRIPSQYNIHPFLEDITSNVTTCIGLVGLSLAIWLQWHVCQSYISQETKV